MCVINLLRVNLHLINWQRAVGIRIRPRGRLWNAKQRSEREKYTHHELPMPHDENDGLGNENEEHTKGEDDDQPSLYCALSTQHAVVNRSLYHHRRRHEVRGKDLGLVGRRLL